MAHEVKHLKTSLETTDNGNEDNRQQPKIYAKDSLDRFGDDLCALLLSYLSLEDRFQCECVSKQFQRTVFGSVVNITLSDGFIHRLLKEKTSDIQLLATFAIKCSYIQTIDCRGIGIGYEFHIPKVLNTLRQYCRHLQNIYSNLCANCDQWICQLGPLVTRIGGIESCYDILALLHCHRLSRLRVNSILDLFDENETLFAKNLHKIEITNRLYDSVGHKLSAFVAHNQSLRSASFKIDVKIAELSQHLSRLTQLRELRLDLYLFNVKNSLSESLRTIGLNCKQLQRLTLEFSAYQSELNHKTLDSLRYYHRLKRFDLKLNANLNHEVLEPLKLCHRLTHLTLKLKQMSDKSLDNCDKQWPRLHYLSIKANAITRECLYYISRLPALQMLVIHCFRGNYLSDNYLNAVLSSSPKLKTIEIRVNNEKKFYSHMTQEMISMKALLVTKDESNEDDVQQAKLYAKNSMYRFGDDMYGLILSYLSLEDKFRLECVSKQFQRTVFESVIDIDINDIFLKRMRIEYNSEGLTRIAKKCPNIQSIEFRDIKSTKEEHIREVLNTFRANCQHLREIRCNSIVTTSVIFRAFKSVTNEIGYNYSNTGQPINNCLHFTPLCVRSLSDVFDTTSQQLVANKLKKFKFYNNLYDTNELLSAFVAQNQSLKSVFVGNLHAHSPLQVFHQLSRLPQLRELTLGLYLTNGENSLSESLRTIGLNCKQLQRLRLDFSIIYSIQNVNNKTLDSLSSYSRLKRLHLTLNAAVDHQFWEPLKLCHKLTHLTLNINEMSDKLLDNCDKHWPRLQYLYIKINAMKGECLTNISGLPALKTLELRILSGNDLTVSDIENLFSKSPKLKNFKVSDKTVSKFYCLKKCFT